MTSLDPQVARTLVRAAELLVVLIVVHESLYPNTADTTIVSAARRRLDEIAALIGPAPMAAIWQAARAADAQTTVGQFRVVRHIRSA